MLASSIFTSFIELKSERRHNIWKKNGNHFSKNKSIYQKSRTFEKKFFIAYSPRAVIIETATCSRIDTELVLVLPKNSKGFITSIFGGDEINEFCSEKQRLWIEILN